MFKRILVAVDQSKPAEHAIEVTVALATALRASVSVVHVVDSNAAFVSEAAAMDQITLGAMRRDGWRALENAFGRIPPFLQPERVFLEGDPAECIVAMAKERDAALIVIGSHSRGRLANFLLGSTADAVIRKAPCPVVSVRAAAEGEALSFAPSISQTQVHDVTETVTS